MRCHHLIAAPLLVALTACAGGADEKPDALTTSSSSGATEKPRGPAEPYIIRREQFKTNLTSEGPITKDFPKLDAPPAGAEKITYKSGSLGLWGWYLKPEDASDADPVPGVVFLHGGFYLKKSDVDLMKPFLDAGFAVLLPTLRGRNGNPGHHELLYGEVTDAANASRWMAARPEVDETHVYVFGHSMGGGTAALLALDGDVPLAITGSCGGIYSVDTFKRWAEGKGDNTEGLVRFDVNDRDEVELRVFAVHAEELAHRHIAYLGDQETLFLENAEVAKKNAARSNAPLEVVVVKGDHMGALKPALAQFLARIKRDAFGE